jgi:hypothetical protein
MATSDAYLASARAGIRLLFGANTCLGLAEAHAIVAHTPGRRVRSGLFLAGTGAGFCVGLVADSRARARCGRKKPDFAGLGGFPQALKKKRNNRGFSV